MRDVERRDVVQVSGPIGLQRRTIILEMLSEHGTVDLIWSAAQGHQPPGQRFVETSGIRPMYGAKSGGINQADIILRILSPGSRGGEIMNDFASNARVEVIR